MQMQRCHSRTAEMTHASAQEHCRNTAGTLQEPNLNKPHSYRQTPSVLALSAAAQPPDGPRG